jgi:hypothetical protein
VIIAERIGRSRPMAAIELNGVTKRFGAGTAVAAHHRAE